MTKPRPVQVLTNTSHSKRLVQAMMKPTPDKSIALGMAVAYLKAQGLSESEATAYLTAKK